MTEQTAQAFDLKNWSGLEVLPGPARRTRRKVVFAAVSLGLVTILLVAALWLVEGIVDERRSNTIDRLQERLEAETVGKLETLSAWIDGLADRGNRIIRSELVALFMAESSLAHHDPELKRALSEQRPYMRQVLDDLARSHDLHGAYLILPDGGVLLQDRDAPMLHHDTQTPASNARSGASERTISVRQEDGHLLLDLYLPLKANMALDSGTGLEQGTLLLTSRIEDFLLDWLKLEGNWRRGETIALQLPVDGAETSITAKDGGLFRNSVSSVTRSGFSHDQELGFRWIGEHGETKWHVVHHAEATPVFEELKAFAGTARNLALATAGILAAALLALFWRLDSLHHRREARQYRQFATQLHKQAVLLDTVLTTTQDLVLIYQAKEGILYANRSFQERFPGVQQAFPGGDSSLEILLAASQRNDGEPVLAAENGGELRWFHVVGHELPSSGTEELSLVVARDLSELHHRQEAKEQLLEQIIHALARATELVDPYLEGHAVRVERLCSRLAERLDINADQLKTLQRAAILSQFGKIFVPKSVLAKKGRHSAEEERVMRTHVDHALSVLAPIDFDQPVAETISQMHERMDGSGYPHQCQADEISLIARILGVSDVFCARTWPRSYRSSKSQDAVCSILEEQERRYDPNIVHELRALVEQNALDDLQPSPSKPRARLDAAIDELSGE